MFKLFCGQRAARTIAMSLAAAGVCAGFAVVAPGSAAAEEIEIVISHVKALDKFDELSNGDSYARVSIGKDVQKSPVVTQKTEISPNWKIVQKVKPGTHNVKLEILDKDISVDDPIDINRIDKKRTLEFSVNTKSCRIEGFAQDYKCGEKITRAGQETKKAEITFAVNVKK